MGHDAVSLTDLAKSIVRQQAILSLRIAAAFVAALIALPLLNLWVPGFTEAGIGGFSLSWLILAVGFYGFTWLLAKRFVVQSERVEAEILETHRHDAEGRHVEDRRRGESAETGGRDH